MSPVVRHLWRIIFINKTIASSQTMASRIKNFFLMLINNRTYRYCKYGKVYYPQSEHDTIIESALRNEVKSNETKSE